MKKFNIQAQSYRLLVALFILVSVIIINSCKKSVSLPDESTVTREVSLEIKIWLVAQKTDTAAAIAINDVAKQADWKTAHAIKTDSLTYLIVKINLAQQPKFDDSKKIVNRYLVIVKANDIAKDGYLYDIFGDASQISQNTDQYIINYNKNLTTPFTGNLSKLTLKTGIKESEAYTGGTLAKHMVLIGKKHTNNLTIQSTIKLNDYGDCIDWYWNTYENGVLVDQEYLYTTCCGTVTATSVRDHIGAMSVFLRPSCDGSGGGGTGNEDAECTNASASFFNDAASDIEHTTESIIEVPDNSLPSSSRAMKYKWTFVKNTNGYWSGVSYDSGVQKWVTDHFDWVSLSHTSISVVGTMPGGAIELTVNRSTPTILNANSAYMELEFNQKMTIVCKGFPISKAQDFTATSDVWHAN